MPPPIRGRMLSSAFASDVLPSLPIYLPAPPEVRLQMERCGELIGATLGPASSARAVADVGVIPLLTLLQLAVTAREDQRDVCRLHTALGADPGPLVIVIPYTDSLDQAWRAAVHGAIANDARWCICCNGLALRIVDGRRTWARDYCEVDLAATLQDPDGQALLWSLLRGSAFMPPVPALDRAVMLSGRHGIEVCQALGRGVLDALAQIVAALRGRSPSPAIVFDHSLTVLYRVLFLLFAEARALVPLWHPVYRDRYSLDTIVSALLAGRPCRGLWQAVQAISRLAHAGCAAGELKVTPFNGRLFSPSQASTFDRRPICDRVLRGAIIAVSSTPAGAGQARARICYRDLDVEQLGAVYEQVLDYEPSELPGAALVRTRDVRKASGAFYTPRGLTAYLIKRALAPLARDRSSEQIMQLRIVDPAMGSGAFLVAACRFLAAAVEDARVREGQWHPGDITSADRALLRRQIASRCLYGVDVNPMAVQLARLSLWLATLATERPLSFLDHHLVAGDSLVGASPSDVQRQPSRHSTGRGRHQPLPLFESTALHDSLAADAAVRTRLSTDPDDTAAAVRGKERALAALSVSESIVTRWRRVLDLWCAGWFWDADQTPDRRTFGELVHLLLHGRCAIGERVSAPLLDRASQLAEAHRFFHWPLTFPEVFAGGGFDAVVGNPPWDMLRGDSGTETTRGDRRRHARQAVSFFRESGIYRMDGRGHANRYQLFVERTLQLLRDGGRLGLVLPAGVVSDTGGAGLRRHLFDRADVDSITGMDNRAGIFPIHRSVRIALISGTAGRPTLRTSCRFGLTFVDELEDPERPGLNVSRELLKRLSGHDDLGIPEMRSDRDLRILEAINARIPWLGDRSGWAVRFGRELNATDDRHAFTNRTGAPEARVVIEGKQLEPFRVNVAASRHELRRDAAVNGRVPRRTRLAYRDVASATNRLTLIAALVPAGVVTTHTLFCLKTPMPRAHQYVLCALLNSFVANYLMRLRVNTHVTASLMSRLPVPVVRRGDPAFERLKALTQCLMNTATIDAAPEYSELQAIVGDLYGLTADDFEHVLSTFPLIRQAVRDASLARFAQIRAEMCHSSAPGSRSSVARGGV
jgi:hypothetical protein